MNAFENYCPDLSSKTPAEQVEILLSAALDNDLQTIKAVLECTDSNCDKALFYAASQGHVQSVQLLLQRADPKANDSEAFRVACQFGMLDVVTLLLPVSDPQANHNHPLRAAASNGHAEVVRHLLPFTNPKDAGSGALLNAVYKQHWEVADILFDVSDLQEVYKSLQNCESGPWHNFEDEVQARRQKIRIANEVDTHIPIKPTKKM